MEKFLKRTNQIRIHIYKRRPVNMKRVCSIGFCVIVLCSLLLVGVANAGQAAYSITEYGASNAVTVDGKWTSANEWTDAPHTWMSGNTTNSGKFAYKIDFGTYGCEWCVEMLTDTTDNAGDYVRICFDDGNGGGTAPQSGDYMIEITGHSTIKIYSGTGTGWSQLSSASEISWKSTMGTSMWSSTPHWITEVVDVKTDGLVQIPNAPPTGMMVAAFDASTNQYTSWAPGASYLNPNSWGLVGDYSMEGIPEGFNFGAVLMIASAAILIGFYYLRRPKTPNIAAIRA
jgi:hypothetical protein